jgi:tetratricopeptide (TPR) repeat protein
MTVYILALMLAIQSTPQVDDVKDALSRAERFYYEARFRDSVQLLLPANEALQNRNDRLQDKISVKQQLALAYIGMNNTAAAKTLLVEIYGLDGNYSLDPKQYSPKVIALANDAKAEQNKVRCITASLDARKSLESGNAAVLLDILRTSRPKCPELSSIEPAAGDLFYKKGLAEFKRSEFSESAKSLRVAVQFAPGNELAAQYLELSENKLQVMEDRILLQWQKEFESRQFSQAAANYRQMVSMRNVDAAASRAKSEYRKALSGLVETWNRTCPTNDWVRMEDIRKQIDEMLPDPAFGEDIRSSMIACAKPEPKSETSRLDESRLDTKSTAKLDVAVTKPGQKSSCLRMDPVAAMTRLKVRVEPEFPREARAFVQNSKINLTMKARIDESGNVKVIDLQGGNPVINNPVRTAVERWKFSPAIDSTGTRCVDTDILMTIGK